MNTAVKDGIDPVAHIHELGVAARAASARLQLTDTATRNRALVDMADALDYERDLILAANQTDLEAAREAGISAAFLDRLELTDARFAAMVDGLRSIAAQPDPVGSISATERRPSGLQIARMRVPLGVVAVIYESRPNVTADAAGICIKSGNAVILRGGSEAQHSNRAIALALQQGLRRAGVSDTAVQQVATTDRAAVSALLKLDSHIDVVIPRGGKGLVQRISEDARVPVIKHLDGICHVYIDEAADLRRAVEVAVNAKCYRYGICGAMETLLIHAAVAEAVLPELAARFDKEGVELRTCERGQSLLPNTVAATEEDWATEYLAPILSIRIVDSMQDAIDHIAHYGSGHTDAIITDHLAHAETFQRAVDSASVLVNAATCFADGAEYGLGAEIGISTDRLHVRGPVGVEGLTTEKYIVRGDYTTRT